MQTEGTRYAVQLLLPQWTLLDAAAILARLKAWRADVALIERDIERLVFEIPTADLPLHARIAHVTNGPYASALHEALTWTPTWHESWAETESRCPAAMVVELVARRPINHASMLLAFLAVLDAALFSFDERIRPELVLHWIPAKQLLTFDHYLSLRTSLGPCGPAVNIRVANATGRPGELLADTVGLAALGLPDLQTVFHGRDPAEVILRLRLLVRSLFVGDRLDCSWVEEASIVPPVRDALTLELD